ncbi:MAG TPA: hypothetical protein DCM86_06910 [Verrucomicrobiales bacterium]|nr:hypothetical protein [Verrucomicrobiales bacterium]
MIDPGHEHLQEEASRTDPAILPSLGRLLRGLTCLFWGLPLVLVAAVQGAKAEPARLVHLWSALAGFGLVLRGTHLLSRFQPRERVWQSSVDKARMVALINLGLCPFIYWWNRHPSEVFFEVMADLLGLGFLFFLLEMNPVLDRLVAMLPDETLRLETRFFTRVSRLLLAPVLGMTLFYLLLLRFEPSFPVLTGWLSFMSEGGLWVILFLVLLPLAMTMALLWKIKEVIFQSVFGR